MKLNAKVKHAELSKTYLKHTPVLYQLRLHRPLKCDCVTFATKPQSNALGKGTANTTSNLELLLLQLDICLRPEAKFVVVYPSISLGLSWGDGGFHGTLS